MRSLEEERKKLADTVQQLEDSLTEATEAAEQDASQQQILDQMVKELRQQAVEFEETISELTEENKLLFVKYVTHTHRLLLQKLKDATAELVKLRNAEQATPVITTICAPENKIKEELTALQSQFAVEKEELKASFTTENKKAQEEIVSLRTQMSTSSKKAQENFAAQLSALAAEKEHEEASKKAALAKVEKSESRVSELEGTVASLRIELESSRSSTDRKLESLKSEHAIALQALKMENTAALKEKEVECENVRTNIKKLEETVEKQKERLTATGSSEQKVQEELMALQSQISNALSAKDKEHFEKERISIRLEKADKLISELEANIASEQTKLENAQNEKKQQVTELNSRISDLEKAISSHKSDLESLKTSHQKKLDSLEAEHSNSLTKLKEQHAADLHSKIEEIENIRTTCEKKLEATNSQHTEAIEKLKLQMLTAGSNTDKKTKEELVALQMQLTAASSAQEKEKIEKERAIGKLDVSEKHVCELEITIEKLKDDTEKIRENNEKKVECIVLQHSEELKQLQEQHAADLEKKEAEYDNNRSVADKKLEETTMKLKEVAFSESATKKELATIKEELITAKEVTAIFYFSFIDQKESKYAHDKLQQELLAAKKINSNMAISIEEAESNIATLQKQSKSDILRISGIFFFVVHY